MSEGGNIRVRERERERRRAFRAFCVWDRGQFIKKHVRPLHPSRGRSTPLPIVVYGGYARGTAQTVNRIFIILQRWHFPVIFSFYDHFSLLFLICIEKKKKNTTTTPPCTRATHKSPSASFLTCKMTWKLNSLRHDGDPWRGTVTFVRTHIYTKFSFFQFFFLYLLYISDVWPYNVYTDGSVRAFSYFSFPFVQ